MSTAPRVAMSFEGCRTRAEAFARLDAFLDAHDAETVRTVASLFLDERNSCRQIASRITQLRGYLAANRAEIHAEVAAAFDEAGLP